MRGGSTSTVPTNLERLSNKVWAAAVNARNFLKRARVLGPMEGVVAYLGPRLLRPPSSDVQVELSHDLSMTVPAGAPSYRNFATGLYETDVTRVLTSSLEVGACFVDLGASIGYYSLLASRLVGSKGRVYCFEPDLESFQYLQRNVVANSCTNVELVNKAVADRNGPVSWTRPGLERGFVSHETLGRVSVDAVTLDSYWAAIDWPAIDLIKLDIEGSEEDALIGMRECIRRNAKLRLIMELNTQAIARSGSTLAHLVSTLVGLGFSDAYVIELGKWLPLERLLPGSRAVHNVMLARPSA
jgi:FkbM family methyltransferase